MGPTRDNAFLLSLANQVKACAALRPLLSGADGWRGEVTVWKPVFRDPVPTQKRGRPTLRLALGAMSYTLPNVPTQKRGRPTLRPWPAVAIGQIVKWQEAGRVIGIRVGRLWGDRRQFSALLPAGQVLNTAYIERINATFRARMGCLCRRALFGAAGSDASGRDVSDGQRVQLLRRTPKFAPEADGGQAKVGAANADNDGGID